jgi:predicted amidophosphoribosyltransferase
MSDTVEGVLDDLLALVVPAVCVACRRAGEVARNDPLCRACRQGLPWLGSRRCPRCGLPAPCGPRCPARAQAFSGAWAPVAYVDAVPALVNALKERGALGLARLMAAQIAATAPPGQWSGPLGLPVALVPVPADPLRRRRRGVDHAARLAAELALRCGLPVASVLTRPMATGGRQAGLPRSQRLRQDRLAVALRTGDREPPAVAILVDDVHTTGATLHACALALREAGVIDVRAVTYARTLRG